MVVAIPLGSVPGGVSEMADPSCTVAEAKEMHDLNHFEVGIGAWDLVKILGPGSRLFLSQHDTQL